jgi:ADP-ribose pyrophosphatase
MAYKINFLITPKNYTSGLFSANCDSAKKFIIAYFTTNHEFFNTFKLLKDIINNTMHNTRIKVLDTKKIYDGNVSLRLDKFVIEDKIVTKEIVEHLPSVGLIPIIANLDILFVSQYRHAAGKTLLEIPAGKIERGETPRQAALREMAEEIGYIGKLVPLLKMYLAPGYDTELIYVYVVRDLKRIARATRNDDENIRIKRVSLTSAIEKCINGQLEDCKSIAAVLAYARIINSRK